MSDDVTLTAAVRQNLLSLQSTANLVGRTQDRLSTGLRVKNAIDDPVNFFQAKALSDRSSDFNENPRNQMHCTITHSPAIRLHDCTQSINQRKQVASKKF